MKVTALALDPIEKKPLARFFPGSRILSVGSYGCTMHCPWCQNHSIAQPADSHLLEWREMSPKELADLAERSISEGNIGLAYTYNEPLFSWRDVLQCAEEIQARNLQNVLVTNGLVSESKLRALLPFINAFNIDLKGFDQAVYDICGGKLEMVKKNIELACECSHVEVTTLIIPGLNDDMEHIAQEAEWLASISPDIPLHLTRFFPQFRYSRRKPTPLETMYHAQRVAQEHLDDVVLGNV